MKITGSNAYIKFDFENGYVLKADGERLTNKKFVVYIASIKHWEPPYQNEKITQEQILNIIEEVQRNISDNTIQIEFE